MEKLHWYNLPEYVDLNIEDWLSCLFKTPVEIARSPCTNACTGIVVYHSGKRGEAPREFMDWNVLSQMGAIFYINREYLHPIGLAICRNPETSDSPYLLESDDGSWEYDEATIAEQLPLVNRFFSHLNYTA